MTNKEILLDWINFPINPTIFINQDNYIAFLGDTELPFIKVIEYKIRKQILESYLEKPCEETIDSILQDIINDYQINNSGVEKRALNKVLTRFNKPLLK